MSNIFRRLLLTLLILFVLGVIFLPHEHVIQANYNNPPIRQYPPIISVSWSWPPLPSKSHWDFVHQSYEDDATWTNDLKPKIMADINDMLWRLWVDQANPSRLHGLNMEIQVPAFVISDVRLQAIVRRFFEVAREKDLSISIKITGYVWWDYSKTDCVACDHIWDSATHPDWAEHVEWWGWSSNYVWAKNIAPETLWRNWGTPFQIHIPHPNFDSLKFRQLAQSKVLVVGAEIVKEYQKLINERRPYLFTAFIPESEVSYGLNFATADPIVSQFGVNVYRQRHCPTDVLQCLPPKPVDKTREQWITEMSDTYYRPSDFWLTLIQAAQDYLTFIAKTAYDIGIPKDKIISHSILSYKLQSGNQVNQDVSFFDAALNDYSIPGYSFYHEGIIAPSTIDHLMFLKNTRKINKFALVEYLDYADLTEWERNYDSLINNPTIPTAIYVNFQNWDQPLLYKPDGLSLQDDLKLYSGAMLVNELVRNWKSDRNRIFLPFISKFTVGITPSPTRTSTPTNTATPTLTPTNTATPTPTSKMVEVIARLPWQDSGITVQAGDFIHIVYTSGQWRGQNVGGYTGPENPPGIEQDYSCMPMTQSIIGKNALIGRIGNNTPFKVGLQFTGTVLSEGVLYLRMNDCDTWLSDNDGSVFVSIQRHP